MNKKLLKCVAKVLAPLICGACTAVCSLIAGCKLAATDLSVEINPYNSNNESEAK